jgi:hypothetical protein
VHGGDGFAFVIHGDERGALALGNPGEKLGFGGIYNGIALEFDTWYNPDTDDPFDDHVTLWTNGEGPLDTHKSQRIAGPKVHPIADGLIHAAKIRYYPYIAVSTLMTLNINFDAYTYLIFNILPFFMSR